MKVSSENRRLPKLITLAVLCILGALPRFAGLGEAGFYGDEEITAFAARSVALGERPTMPSGMPYDRALGYSLSAGFSAALLDDRAEGSYRVPAAIAGVLAIALFYWLAHTLLGPRAALFAGALLALSEWHVLMSREARMYGPFLFFYTCSSLLALRATMTGSASRLWVALALAVVATGFHPLAAFAALAFALPPLVLRRCRVDIVRCWSAAAFVGVFAAGYSQYVELAAYGRWKAARDISPTGPTRTDPWINFAAFDLSPVRIAAMAAGAVLGAWLVLQLLKQSDAPQRPLLRAAVLSVGAAGGALALGAQFYGAMLFLGIAWLMLPTTPAALHPRTRLPLTLLASGAVASGIWHISTADSLYAGVRSLLTLPFPYLWFLGEMFLGVVLLATAAALLPARPDESEERFALRRILGLLALVPITVIGFVSQWGGMRYVVVAYPFLLLLSAECLDRLASWYERRRAPPAPAIAASIAALCLIASGILGGHGVPQAVRAARLGHGDAANPLSFGFSRYPDHRGPGLYVRERLRSDDIVVAEDALQQRWYTGRVDYWLRNTTYSAPFLYQGTDGRLREIYANSVGLTDTELEALRAMRTKRVWIITSAEARDNEALALAPAQRSWLAELRHTARPEFVGEDGISSVYCLNCAGPSRFSGNVVTAGRSIAP